MSGASKLMLHLKTGRSRLGFNFSGSLGSNKVVHFAAAAEC